MSLDAADDPHVRPGEVRHLAAPGAEGKPAAERAPATAGSVQAACPGSDRLIAARVLRRGGLASASASAASAIGIGRPAAGLEGLEDRALPGRAHAAMDVDRNELD